jgi:hypothetical protein
MTIDIDSLIDAQSADLGAAIETLDKVDTRLFGLDESQGRAGKVYVDWENRVIYCPASNLRGLDYYGGFEYVKEGDGRQTLAGFTRFDGYESERVAECFEIYAEMLADEQYTNQGEAA